MMCDVTKQRHYTQFAIQPYVFIEKNRLSFSAGNIIKYVCRHELKNGVEDLKKARVYLDCLIHHAETGEVITPDKLNQNDEEKKL